MDFNNRELLEKGKRADQGWARLWVGYAFWASITGWGLSLLNNLTPFAYALSFLLCAGVTWRFREAWGFHRGSFGLNFLKFKRWKRLFPACFLVLLALALIGGVVYAPNNYDFLSYRFSRMLHWWVEDGWLWINTPDNRMNYSGVTFEWLTMPLLLLVGSDRLVFLINLFSFALLPGLLFSVFRDLGVGRRCSWCWMWIFPAAYCYVLQAGSAANDALAAVFLLAAVHFFYRSSREGGTRDFWWGMLAAALLTGTKLSNLPLLLPCLIVALPGFKAAWRKPVLFAVFAAMGVMISILPIVCANVSFAGHWTGDALNSEKMQLKNPVAAFLGNSIQLMAQNLTPPVLPIAGTVTRHLNEAIPESLKDLLGRDFPRFSLGMGELPQEESVGLGLGIAVLTGVTLAASFFTRRKTVRAKRSGTAKWFCAAALVSTFVFMAKMGSECTGRLLCGYYPLLLIPLLFFMDGRGLTRRRWWRGLAGLVMASALIPLILTPSRPLFPAQSILEVVEKVFPKSPVLERARMVYEVYHTRADVLAPIREKLAADISVIGFLGGIDDIEISLWKPFEKRAVVTPKFGADLPEWVVLNTQGAQLRGFDSVESWLKENHYHSVIQVPVISKVKEGIVIWTIAKSDSDKNWYSPLEKKRLPGWVLFLSVGLGIGLGKLFKPGERTPGVQEENPIVLAFLKGWVVWTGGVALGGWVLSYVADLSWMGAVAVFFGTFVLYRIRPHWKGAPWTERKELLGYLKYTPWLVLSLAMILADILYAPATLDSLTYRIPRILYWLQEGKISYIPGCEARLNYMTGNWELTSIPFFMAGSDKLLRVPSLISWIILYLVFCQWARTLIRDPQRVAAGAFLCSASTVWVLQGASSVNDLFAAVFLLLSVYFAVRFEKNPTFADLAFSGFSLVFAAGTKPHFSVMALPWVLWFLFSLSRPWRKIASWHLLWLAPAALLASPLPTFLMNHARYGSWKGEPDDPFLTAGSWFGNLVFGTLMMFWQMIQPPFNPWYSQQNFQANIWIDQLGWRNLVPRFSLDAKPAMIVDGASFGLVSSVILVMGLWLFFRKKELLKSWALYAGLAGVVGFALAISQVVPGSVGRSFSGFFLLLFPAALCGLAGLSRKTSRVLITLAFCSGLFSIVFSASHPLWPAKTAAALMERYDPDFSHLESLKQYANFSRRYDTARDLVRMVPESEEVLLAIVPADRPLLQLWEPYRFHRRVVTFDKDVTAEEIVRQPGDYMIVAAGFGEFYPQLVPWLLSESDFTEVAAGNYVSKLERGPESWRLFKRVKN